MAVGKKERRVYSYILYPIRVAHLLDLRVVCVCACMCGMCVNALSDTPRARAASRVRSQARVHRSTARGAASARMRARGPAAPPPAAAAPVRADIILYRINICTCGTRFRNKSRRVCSQHTLATHPCTRALLLVLSGRQSSCRTNGWRRSARPRRSPRRGGALEGGPEGAS